MSSRSRLALFSLRLTLGAQPLAHLEKMQASSTLSIPNEFYLGVWSSTFARVGALLALLSCSYHALQRFWLSPNQCACNAVQQRCLVLTLTDQYQPLEATVRRPKSRQVQNVDKSARFVIFDVAKCAQKVSILPTAYYVDEAGGSRPPVL